MQIHAHPLWMPHDNYDLYMLYLCNFGTHLTKHQMVLKFPNVSQDKCFLLVSPINDTFLRNLISPSEKVTECNHLLFEGKEWRMCMFFGREQRTSLSMGTGRRKGILMPWLLWRDALAFFPLTVKQGLEKRTQVCAADFENEISEMLKGLRALLKLCHRSFCAFLSKLSIWRQLGHPHGLKVLNSDWNLWSWPLPSSCATSTNGDQNRIQWHQNADVLHFCNRKVFLSP